MNADNSTATMTGITTAALLLASAQAPLGSTLIAVALPIISVAIHADLVLVTSLLVTGYLVVNVVCQGPAGKISDLVGHSRILWTGICLYVIGALIGLMAQDVSLLMVSRCIMAAAGAMVVPATLALLRLHVPHGQRGRVFGLFGATMGIAAASGPALGGEIVQLFGWRAIFVANLPFLALAAILLRAFPMPKSVNSHGQSFVKIIRSLDFLGTALLSLSLTLLIVSSKAEGAYLFAIFLCAIIAGIAFVLWETRAAQPVFDPKLFALPAFAAGTSITALQNFAMYGLLFELPQFFTVFRGAAPREIGYMLFVMMVGMVIASPVGGQIVDRAGARLAALLGVLPLLLGVLMLWRLTSFADPKDALQSLLLFGIGMGLCSAPAQSAAMSVVDPKDAGMAAGVSSTMRYMGSITSILIMGIVLGDDTVVSVERHELMVKLFTAAIAISVLVSFRLPGRITANTST